MVKYHLFLILKGIVVSKKIHNTAIPKNRAITQQSTDFEKADK